MLLSVCLCYTLGIHLVKYIDHRCQSQMMSCATQMMTMGSDQTQTMVIIILKRNHRCQSQMTCPKSGMLMMSEPHVVQLCFADLQLYCGQSSPLLSRDALANSERNMRTRARTNYMNHCVRPHSGLAHSVSRALCSGLVNS